MSTTFYRDEKSTRDLYRFELDEFTGRITVTRIDKSDITVRIWEKDNTIVYFYNEGNYSGRIASYNIDVFKNWRLYTFDYSKEEVEKIIRDNLSAKENKAKNEYERYHEVLKNLHMM